MGTRGRKRRLGIEDEYRRLILGGLGTVDAAWEEEFPPEVAAVYRNVVLRDVEGNEFCLGGGAFPS